MSKHYTIHVLIVSMLAVAIFLFGIIFPTQAQNPATTPTPDAVQTLQTHINAQATQIAYFEVRTELNKDAMEIAAREQLLPFTIASLIIGGIVGGLGITVGVGTFLRFRRRAEKIYNEVIEKTTTKFESAIYDLSPKYMPIHIPSFHAEFQQKEWGWLQKLGFSDLRPYTDLAQVQRRGVFIYVPQGDEDMSVLSEFAKQLDPTHMGILVYTRYVSGGRVNMDKLQEVFDNVASANFASTLAPRIYDLARNVLIAPQQPPP